MKVNMPKDYKKTFTIHQLEIAKEVIKYMKDDESTPEDYAKMVVNHILYRSDWNDGIEKVLDASAEVETNGKWDRIYDGSEDIDIVIEAYVKTWDRVCYIIARMSDIWNLDGEHDYRDKFYYETFKRTHGRDE